MQKNINNILSWHYILFCIYYPCNKSLISILFNYGNFFTDILKQKTISFIIRDKLSSNYKYDWNILIYSTTYLYLTGKLWLYNKALKEEMTEKIKSANKSLNINQIKLKNPKIFSFIRKNEVTRTMKNNHINLFLIFTHSVSLRMFLELISYCITLFFVFIVFITQIGIFRKIYKINVEFKNLLKYTIINKLITYQDILNLNLSNNKDKIEKFCFQINDQSKNHVFEACLKYFDVLKLVFEYFYFLEKNNENFIFKIEDIYILFYLKF